MRQWFQLHNTYLFSDAGETTSLAALVNWIDDPVNPGITANLKFHSVNIQNQGGKKDETHSLVVGIDEDNFVIFVNTVLIHPVGVQHSQISASLAHPLLSSTPETTLELEVVDTLTNGFTKGCTYNYPQE